MHTASPKVAEDSCPDVELALFSAGAAISKQVGPIASDAGATVVDNSSAFRMAQGVPRDNVRSLMWFELASAAGVQQAAEKIPILTRVMGADEVARGRRLAAEWKPSGTGDD